MPVKVLGLEIESEDVRQQAIQRGGNVSRRARRQIRRRTKRGVAVSLGLVHGHLSDSFSWWGSDDRRQAGRWPRRRHGGSCRSLRPRHEPVDLRKSGADLAASAARALARFCLDLDALAAIRTITAWGRSRGYGRSNNRNSVPSAVAFTVSAGRSLTAAPSPVRKLLPFNSTAPRTTWIQPRRPVASACVTVSSLSSSDA